MGVVKHWRILFSPTILLLYDVTLGSPDDEFQEYPKQFSRYVHDLGVVLDDELSMKPRINKVTSVAF